MSESSKPDPVRQQRLDEAVARFLLAEEAGTPLDPETWIASEPGDLRADLEQFLADRAAVQAVTGTAVHPDDGFQAGDTFDRLRIVGFIRAGGMGRVYSAVQEGLNRTVAVKTLPGGPQNVQFRRAFEREVASLGRLTHDHIVTVYGCGERSGRPYLVLELMASTLRDRLAAGPIPEEEAADLVRAVALAVQYAHDRGIMHRDIKPSNILLDSDGVPHLGDFGLATHPEATNADRRAGTQGYMAPEQWSGDITLRTDIYGLGAILYQCLTGKPPSDPLATKWAPPVPLARRKPKLDRRLIAICERCLAENPDQRYPTAGAVADALSRYLRTRRRRPLVWIGAVSLLMLLSVGALWWFYPNRTPVADQGDLEESERYLTLMAAVKERANTRPMGWTWDNRAAIKEAAGLETRRKKIAELRSELARTLSYPDIREVGTFAHGQRYAVAAFRPGTKGNQIALGEFWKADGLVISVRIDLFDRTENRVLRTWSVPVNFVWAAANKKHEGVRGLAFTPDGRWLAVGTTGSSLINVPFNSQPRAVVVTVSRSYAH